MNLRTVDNAIIIFGGEDDTGFGTNNLYRLDITNSSWTLITTEVGSPVPPVRHSHAGEYLPEDDILFIYGGMNGQYAQCDAWAFSFATLVWTQVADTTKCRGRFVSAAIGDLLYVYGGVDETYSVVDDFYTLNVSTVNLINYCQMRTGQVDDIAAISEGVSPGKQTHGAMLSFGDVIYLFGGTHLQLYSNILYAFNTGKPMNV